MIRQLLMLIAVASVLAGLAASPAAADPPTVFESTDVIPGINPCTGEDDAVTIHRVFGVHEHDNNAVWIVSNTGESESGFVMEHGHAQLTFNASLGETEARVNVSDQWIHPETGQRFHVTQRGVLDLATGDFDGSFVQRCLGAPAA